MFKSKMSKVDMMQKKMRYIFKIPLIISLGISLAIMIDQVVYGTGGFYEDYYTFAPYSETAPYGLHDGITACYVCHYGHGDDKTRTEFLTAKGVGVDACGSTDCHTNAYDTIVNRPSSPVANLYNSTNSPYKGITAYELSAHATVSNMFWPGATSTISAYPQISSLVTDAEGACFNCHNPHGQPDPDSGETPTKPFLCKVVAGIDVCFERDIGSPVNGITGNSAGGVDPDTAENLCYVCHGTVATNYDYSNRISFVSIEDQFDRASHHPVKDSDQSSVALDPVNSWKVECNVCHNPHICQKSTKDSVSPSSPISRVGDNTTLWGDGADEKMDDYIEPATEIYQPPTGEPTAANLTDFNTFCLDCHGGANNYNGLNYDPIDWSSAGDKHGKNAADTDIDIDSPYSNTNVGKYVLACTDCHEPHGSTNVFLIRTEVNGGTVGSGTVTTTSSSDCTPPYTDSLDDWKNLCSRCHDDDYESIHHLYTDRPIIPTQCSNCHEGSGGKDPINCSCCHYHGSSYDGLVTF